MAFGLKREELYAWKEAVNRGEVAFLTHYWIDDRFPGATTVTKVGCGDIEKLIQWGRNIIFRLNILIIVQATLILIYLDNDSVKY